MTSTEQLEREAEMSRQQLLGTVEELRARLTPRQMVNQVLDYVGDGDGAEFARNFKNQVVANPLPATLMSAGLAWLMLAGKRPARADYTADAAHRRMHDVRDEASDMVAGASEAGQSIAEGAGTATVSVKNAAASTLGAATEAYESIASRATKSATAAADTARNLGQNARATTRSVTDFCRDQPLVLAGLGIAIGAALGALLPGTEAEDSLMGEAADEVKDEMQQTATETYDKAAAVATSAIDAATNEAVNQGLIGEASPATADQSAPLVPDHPEDEAPVASPPRPASSPVLDP